MMKTTLTWAAVIVGGAAGVTLAYAWLSAARRGIARGLEQGEAIADEARATLAHAERAADRTERTLRTMRDTIA